MLRVAIFSDVHGNLAALRAVLAAIDRQGPIPIVVAAGDLVFPAGARPAETFDLLLASRCVLLFGNHDDLVAAQTDEGPPGRYTASTQRQIPWCLERLGPRRVAALCRLPRQLRLSPSPGGDLLIVHSSLIDTGSNAATRDTDEAALRGSYGGANARVIAFGHWHESFVRSWAEGILVNVASVSLPRDNQPLAAYTILTWQKSDWTIEQFRVPYDTGDEAAAAVANGLPE